MEIKLLKQSLLDLSSKNSSISLAKCVADITKAIFAISTYPSDAKAVMIVVVTFADVTKQSHVLMLVLFKPSMIVPRIPGAYVSLRRKKIALTFSIFLFLYEMVNSQRGASLPIIISYPTSSSGIIVLLKTATK